MAKKKGNSRLINESFIRAHFENQYGLDIETTGLGGLDARQNEILQIGIQKPGGMSYEINVRQDKYIPSKFHQRPGGLHEYYVKQGINVEEETALRSVTDEHNRRYLSVVVNKERAKKVAKHLTQAGNTPVNIIIHNAQFEVKHFNRFFAGNSPFDFSENYKELINQNKRARHQDVIDFHSGRLSPAEFRSRDAQRQVAVYNQILEDARVGGNIIDSMEIAKTANALAQKRNLIPATGDIALGSNVEFLSDVFLGEKELHRAVQDVRQQNLLAPKLVRLVEKLKRDDFNPSMLSTTEQKWVTKWQKNAIHMKVDATKKAIQQAIDTIETGATFKFRSGTMATRDINEFISYLSRTGKYESKISQGLRVIDYGISQQEIVSRAIKGLDPKYSSLLKGTKTPLMTRGRAALALGGAAALIGAIGLVSGNDEDYNTIEGLRHGWFGESRKYLTDFGSGYQGKDYSVVETEAPTPYNWGLISTIGGVGLTGSLVFHKSSRVDLSSLAYMGQAPEGYNSMSEFLGRTKATYGDILYNTIRRGEYAMGGFPKAFSVSTYLSQHIFRDVTHSLDLTKKSSSLYANYLRSLTGVDLLREGITNVRYEKGKLVVGSGEQAGRVLLEEARLFQAIHDPNITKSKAQFVKSLESIMGSTGVGREHELLIAGGKNKFNAAFRNMHAYAHESISKYLRLVDDPAKAIRDILPDTDDRIISGLKKVTRFMPKMGVGGEKNLVGTVPQLLQRHAGRALPALLGIPFAFGMLDWAVRQVSPEGTIPGQAGLSGVLAETGRAAHTSYAFVSDTLGLTDLRKSAEEQAPGMTGILPFAGITFSGALTGMFSGAAFGLYKEIAAKQSYKQLVENKTKLSKMPQFLSKIPGMRGEYTRTGRWTRVGLAIGAALASPMLLAGLGSSKSTEELNQEYLEGKEVAVKKGRWWELGMTPFEGSKTLYYRPNWYNRILSQYKRKSLYGDEDISPLGRLARSFIDPYWEEKKHYHDRPYPVASSTGEGLGIFGPLYERTIGQIMKPAAYMHMEELGGAPAGGAGSGIGYAGESGEEAMSPFSVKQDLKQQYYATYEAIGLRGFVGSVVKEAVTGSRDLFQDTAILQSSADMTSSRRTFWDWNLGGGLGLTEPIRRFIPNRPYTDEYINPLANQMPSWLPGSEYYIDFKTGDPYTKIAEGEFRLPGTGYEARYPELRGLDPEKYPLIHQYKILADVAPYSRQLKFKTKSLERRFEAGELSEEERIIFEETKKQLEDRLQSRQFNKDEEYKGAFGAYSRWLADTALKNPLEHLSPLSPAHKFLPSMDPLSEYEEEVFAKEFKLWQNPVDDYIKPFMHMVGHTVGLDVVPEYLEEARQIEEYFDQLKYIKFRRLQEKASETGDWRSYFSAKTKAEGTLTGADVYSDNFPVFALPKREKEFFEAFKTVPDEDKSRILELVPRNLREVYIAQWDKELAKKIEEGQLEASEEELYNLKQDINHRHAIINARRAARQRYLEHHSQDLPPDDWIGWSAEVDLQDVKLQYLVTTGRDHHFYNLWEDRLRGLRRKPFIEQAVEDINPEMPLIRKRVQESELLQMAGQSGLRNATVSLSGSPDDMAMISVNYDSQMEEDEALRELGYVI